MIVKNYFNVGNPPYSGQGGMMEKRYEVNFMNALGLQTNKDINFRTMEEAIDYIKGVELEPDESVEIGCVLTVDIDVF